MTEVSVQAGVIIRLRARLLLRSALKRYTRSAKEAAPLRLAVMVLLGLGFLALVSFNLGLLLNATLVTQGRAQLTSALAVSTSGLSIVIFFYAVISLLSKLTYRSDLRLLLLTPVSPRVLVADKLLGTSWGLSGMLVLLIPGLLQVGNLLHLETAYVLVAIFLLLVMPIAPASVALLLVLAALRVLPPARARAITTIFSTVLSACLFIGSQILFSSRLGSSVDVVVPAAFPTAWPGRFLAAAGLGNGGEAAVFGALTLLLAAATFAAAVEVGGRVLATGSQTYQEVGRRPRRPGRARLALGSGSTPLPLVRKEWLLFRRDSQRLAAFIYPLLLAVFYLYQLHAGASSGAFSGSVDLVVIFLTVILVNSVAPTIVNREGRSLYLLALAPVSDRHLFLVKWAVCAVPVVVVAESLLAAGTALTANPVPAALLSAVTMALLVVALSGLTLVFNLIWPRLATREGERAAGQMASWISLFFDALFGAATFVLLYVARALWASMPVLSSLSYGALLFVFFLTLTGTLFAGPRLLHRLLVSERVRR